MLLASIGDRAFSTVTKTGTITTTFSVYHFEALTQGIQSCLDRLDMSDVAKMRDLGESLTSIKKSSELREVVIGGGQNYRDPLERRIAIVAQSIGALV